MAVKNQCVEEFILGSLASFSSVQVASFFRATYHAQSSTNRTPTVIEF